MLHSLSDKINKSDFPKHIAIIMDGNGRWAQKQGKIRTFGHKNAIKAVKDTVKTCGEIGIPYLTLYAFSTENWKRPKAEVDFLMKLLAKTIKSEILELHENGVRLRAIGDLEKLPKQVLKLLNEASELTKNNQKVNLNLALNYGSKDEILKAVKQIALAVQQKEIDIEDINSDSFEQNLFTKGIPHVDLLIRTSGEYRISNFLLWQIAYSELYFTDTLWPDFGKEDLMMAINEYVSRERRYGKTGEQIKTEQK